MAFTSQWAVMVYLKTRAWTYLLAGSCLTLPACATRQPEPAAVVPAAGPITAAELPVAYQGAVFHTQPKIAAQHEGVIGSPDKGLIRKGHISMRLQKAYVAPPTPESLESRINRVVSQRLTDSEARLRQYSDKQTAATEQELSALAQRNQQEMRKIAADTLTDSEDFIRALARDTLLSQDDQIRSVISKVAEDTVINADQNLADAIRKVARQVVVDGDETVVAAIRKQAKSTMLNADEDIEEAIRRVAKQTVVESDDQIDDAIRRVARSTVLEADPQVMNAIRKVVNLAVLESDEPVEYTVRRIMEERFSEIKDDPIAVAVRAVTKDAVREEAERVANDTKDYTRMQVALSAAEQKNALQQTQNALVNAVGRSRDGEVALQQKVADVLAQTKQSNSELKAYVDQKAAVAKADDRVLQAQLQQALLNQRHQTELLTAAQALQTEKLTAKQRVQAERLLAAQEKALLEAKVAVADALAQSRLSDTELKAYVDQRVADQQENLSQANAEAQLAAQQLKSEMVQTAAAAEANDNALRAQLTQALLQQQHQTELLAAAQELQTEKLTAEQRVQAERLLAAQQQALAASKAAVADVMAQQKIALLEAQKENQEKTHQLRIYTEQALASQKQDNKLLQEKVQLMTDLAEARAKAYADDQVADAKAYVDEIAQAEALAAEHRLRDYAADQLTRLEDKTLETIVGAMATTEATLRDEAAAKAQEVEDRLTAYTDHKAQDVLKKSDATIQEVAAATRLTDEEIRAVAESTLADSTDTIRALALQTLADSDNYIRTVAREAVKEKDPAMEQAFVSAARQVILDENNEVAFAIRRVVDDAVDAKAEELVAKAENIVQHDGVVRSVGTDVDEDALKIAKLQEPGAETGEMDIRSPRFRQDWVNIRSYHLVLHEDNATLDDILRRVLSRAEPFVGPWELKWKISEENKDILHERFSLDAETTFEDFANYLAQYMMNTRGILLNFNMFDAERVLVVSDE